MEPSASNTFTCPMNPSKLKMLSPLRVGAHTLRNRVVMGSMHTRLEHMDDSLRRETAFYAARAAGGVAMIVTGGYAPNDEGRMEPGGPMLVNDEQADRLAPLVQAVHEQGAKFLLQILHAGRYAKHDAVVGVSARPSPINPRAPRPLTAEEIERTLEDYLRCARLARQAGFDGVEVMGSEGYLINQFTAPCTNDRTDGWGTDLEGRCRFPVELTRRLRAEMGPEFLIMYRISAIDLVPGGATAEETDYLARAVEAAGADLLNTGYGWHEAPVPTIAFQVPRGAWAFGAERLKKVVGIPVMASNRINTPELAEHLLASEACDLVSMARPMLADPDFVKKVAEGRPAEINSCIACNQSCLDHIFTDRTATCLVNPRAGREIEFGEGKSAHPRRIAVVGSGPGGMSAAVEAARRGHHVTLFESESFIGGQLNLARRVPGKSEFDELLRYFRVQLAANGVAVRLGCTVDVALLQQEDFAHVVLATGVVPRVPAIPGIDHPMVLGYAEVLLGRVAVGDKVAIIGTGGIAHDVAELLSHPESSGSALEEFHVEWGVDSTLSVPGGVVQPRPRQGAREITLFQRSEGRVGERLGKSTGWIVRNRLRARGVRAIAGASYTKVDDQGLHYHHGGQDYVARVDSIVLCAGQESEVALAMQLRAAGMPFDLIGGARLAGELDAARAIDEGTRLANLI